MSIRLLLADDHDVFRQSLRQVLESEPDFVVVAEARSGAEAVRLAEEHQPDVAIVDVRMPELNGIAAVAEILRQSPNTAVLMLSVHADRQYVIRSVEAGARGYMLKDSAEQVLIGAIRTVREGDRYFSPEIAPLAQDAVLRAPKAL